MTPWEPCSAVGITWHWTRALQQAGMPCECFSHPSQVLEIDHPGWQVGLPTSAPEQERREEVAGWYQVLHWDLPSMYLLKSKVKSSLSFTHSQFQLLRFRNSCHVSPISPPFHNDIVLRRFPLTWDILTYQLKKSNSSF